MNYGAAKEYCANQGTRLPSIRELAEHATSLGAEGIRETQYPNAHMNSPEVNHERELNNFDGFKPVTTEIRTADRYRYPYTTTLFYYNRSGFKQVDPCVGGAGSTGIWSADRSWDEFYYIMSCGSIHKLNPYFEFSYAQCIK